MDAFNKFKEQARKEIQIAREESISKYTQKGFTLVDNIINGIHMADEFLVLEKDNTKFVILDSIYSCSKNTETIEAVCPECKHYNNCSYLKEYL